MHRWATYNDTQPDIDWGEAGTEIDVFAADVPGHFCNGPKCLACDLQECHHCQREIYEEECPCS